MPSLCVLRPGMLTTVQDLGRWGHQAAGVPVAGPMDPYSHRLANRLVDNDDGAAALEITLLGPVLQAVGDLQCAIAGAEFEVTVDRNAVACGRPFVVRHGATVQFGRCLAGARASLAVGGGIAVEPVLGSRATSIVGRMGPFGGRPLAAGDILPIGHRYGESDRRPIGMPLSLPRGGARLRAMPGPHEALFSAPALERFFSAGFTVTPSSNRMGYRLDGPPLPRSDATEILSDATPIGSVQVPRSGQPILLMADRQTTGGYPKIATVITADLSVAGQLAPGDWIRFVRCSRSEAVDALQRLERRLSGRKP